MRTVGRSPIRSQFTGHRRARFTALIAAVPVVALLASCSSSKGSDGGNPSSAATTASAVDPSLFPAKPATGSVVKIGVMWPEGGPAVSQPEDGAAVQAVTEYANNNLGGIAGHKIELFTCKNKENSASATDCANQMVEQKVAAVLSVTSGFGDNMVPIIVKSGIPYVSAGSASALEATTPGAFMWNGGFAATLIGLASYSKTHNYKNVAAFAVNVPAAVGGATAIGVPVFKAQGVGFKVVPIPPGIPDTTPQVTAGVSDEPDAIEIIGDGTVCTSVLQALKTVAYAGDRVVIQACLNPSTIKALGSSMNGVHLLATADPYTNDPESVLYRAVMAKYAPNSTTGGYAVTGYQGMLGLVRAAQGLTGDPTPAAFITAISTAKNVPLPAGHGLTFTCDGKALPGSVTACSSGVLIGEVKDGTAASFEAIG